MQKFYCDRCGDEITRQGGDNIKPIFLGDPRDNRHSYKEYELCNNCRMVIQIVIEEMEILDITRNGNEKI